MGSGRLIRLPAAVTALTLALGLASAASATTITVTTTDDSLSVDGQCSLREAIQAVNTPGSIVDTCTPADDQSNTIVLGPHEYDLTIHPDASDAQQTGDLDVTGTTPLTIMGAGVNATSINGAQLQDRILHVVAGATVTIEDLTITGAHAPNGAAGTPGSPFPPPDGTAPGNGQPGFPGGGIRNEGTLSLSGVAVTNNTAGSGGGGATGFALGPTPLDGGEGTPGGAAGAGGGIYNDAPGTLHLTDVTVSGNVAGDGGHGGAGGPGPGTAFGGAGANGGCCGDGGGIDNAGGTVTITDSTFSGNHAGAGGAGGAGGLSSSAFGGAGGQGQGGSSGGAIATTGGSISITDSTLSGNFAGAGGNGGNGGGSALTSAVSSKKGGDAGNGSAGGALFVSGSATATLKDVTIADNRVGSPGTPGSASAGDSKSLPGLPGAAAFGGGVYVSTTPAATVSNTLLSDNELGNCAGNLADGTHNLSFGVSAGCPSGFAIGDPKLGPLQDNGGPTFTRSLQAGSAAIDQGGSCAASDERGLPRPSGPACDIGAYEVTPPGVTGVTSSAVTSTGATITASVTANQASASVTIDFGTTTAYGSTVTAPSGAGLTPQQISASVSGLKPNTTYHYRLAVTSPDGTLDSTDATFTTAKPPAPKISHLSVKVSRKGVTITYRDSEAATTALALTRGKHKLKSLTHHDRAGKNAIKVKRLRLKPGTYKLRATATIDGVRGKPAGKTFKVRRRR